MTTDIRDLGDIPCTCWKPSHSHDVDCPKHGQQGGQTFNTPPRLKPGDPGYHLTHEDFEGRVATREPIRGR